MSTCTMTQKDNGLDSKVIEPVPYCLFDSHDHSFQTKLESGGLREVGLEKICCVIN